jgi:hypothetical protein
MEVQQDMRATLQLGAAVQLLRFWLGLGGHLCWDSIKAQGPKNDECSVGRNDAHTLPP